VGLDSGQVLRCAQNDDTAGKTDDTAGDPVVRIGNLDTQRDFVAVEDAVEAYLRLIRCDCWGEVFNVCSGQPRSIRSLVEQLLGFSKRPVRLLVDPALVRPADVPVAYGSWEKAHRAAGFAPATRLEDALRSAWNHAMEAKEQTK
jgi:GDP-4-dehydro-6-deoxy-D-mannose reductase